MARTKKPYMVFETKEAFDNKFEEVYQAGKVQGFNDGTIWLLSYIQELFGDIFKPAAFKAAQTEIRSRQLEKWRKEENLKSLKQELDFKNFMSNTLKEIEKHKDEV